MDVGFYKLERRTIAECAFADDLAIIAKSEEELQHNLNIWDQELKKHNMTINIEKTKIMVISKEETKTHITINRRIGEQVETFTYLGSTINGRGSIEHEINKRIQAANRS